MPSGQGQHRYALSSRHVCIEVLTVGRWTGSGSLRWPSTSDGGLEHLTRYFLYACHVVHTHVHPCPMHSKAPWVIAQPARALSTVLSSSLHAIPLRPSYCAQVDVMYDLWHPQPGPADHGHHFFFALGLCLPTQHPPIASKDGGLSSSSVALWPAPQATR